ncbi:hypothetical protein Tco_0651977 [Tanacetum coccineum]|uniref:Uncharacterized protein n=1 Tax=Tanacetum coccineum TaxID=301880 RepID=A0ABQ4WWA5_9ASTR
MSGSDDVPPPPPPPTPQTQPQQVPHTMSTIKLPILKKGEYDIWSMKMEHYLAYTDYPIWEVIQKGNGPVSITTDTQWIVKVLPLRTVEEALAREKERKARTTLLMALPEDHLAKFHKMTDAKEMWDAIKSRFGGNDESKKMQNQLEIHGAGVLTEDANQKFLRSLPSSWSQVYLIMRTKPGIDDLSSDDLYNNLKVFEYDIKGSNTSSSNSPNVAFVSSIRCDLLFDDADGIDVLNNHDIFDNIQLMRYLDAKKKFVMYPRFISIFLDKQLKNVHVPLDHFPINALTSKVFSFMVKKGKHFLGNITPMFASMLVPPTQDEGEASERQSEPQPIPSPHHSADLHETEPDHSPNPLPSIPIPDPIPEVTAQAKEITTLKAKLKKLRRKAKPFISHHQAWVKSVKKKQRLAKKESLKKKRMQKESVSKQGRKSAKAEPSVPKDPAFDDFDGLDYMETEAHTEDGVSTEATVSTDTQKVSTDRAREGTDTVKVSTDEVKETIDKENQGNDSTKVSTDKVEEGTAKARGGQRTTLTTPTPTPTTFGDDETIAQVLLNMSQAKAVSREKEKGVKLKDVENVERQRLASTRSVLTLKPLPKIDPKDNCIR